ncbi:TPA: amidohydrolase family protein [Pseudomonas putida]|uniref:amidohydrolase family protein n=1 Tax=Pseudomonas putida TaxID=303 RepID=UPI0023634EFF|nr:amidohydrolase family protein [Pseudomonas putida]MDD2076529.1 amidohydrolase family protein [Pseudomonas putida]HDS1692433.1 amidohydrolase family protein [Pseudomonas putida]
MSLNEFTPLPPGSIDAHMHFYAPGPHHDNAPFDVPQARPRDYLKLMADLGVDRVLLVQSMLYGADNSVMLSALRELGTRARAIAVTRPDASDACWDDLAAQGVIGLRAFMLANPLFSWGDLPRLAARLDERGWQLHLQLDGCELVDRAAMLASLPCPVVIDHVGKFLSPVTAESPSFIALLRLLETGNIWTKISGLYETSRTGPPAYADTSSLAGIVVRHAPNRVLWASNWPHPNLQPAPSDRELVDLIRDIVPDEAMQRLLFVQNASELFGFKGV